MRSISQPLFADIFESFVTIKSGPNTKISHASWVASKSSVVSATTVTLQVPGGGGGGGGLDCPAFSIYKMFMPQLSVFAVVTTSPSDAA